MNDYPRPGYYRAPDHLVAAAHDKASQAVRDLVLNPSAEEATQTGTRQLAEHSASLAVDQPLACLEAAAELEKAASELVAEHIRLARQVGGPWIEIANALHLDAVALVTKESAAEEAFSFALQYSSLPGNRGFAWTCGACGQQIADHGPAMEIPESEDGHAADCPRHNAQLLIWNAHRAGYRRSAEE
jgi:hypothetical protein